MRHALAALLTSLALSMPALGDDGVEIEMENTVYEDGVAQKQAQVVRSDGAKLRITLPSKKDPEGKTSTAIFDGKAIVLLDHTTKEWDQFDLETAKRIAEMQKRALDRTGGGAGGIPGMTPEQVEEMKTTLREQLANLPAQVPASVRKTIEDQLKRLEEASQPKDAGEGGAAGRTEPKVRVVEEGSAKVGEVECVKWGVFDGERRLKDVFAVSADKVAPAGRSLPAYLAYAKFMSELLALMPSTKIFGGNRTLALELEKIQGFPYATVEYDEKGAKTSESRFKAARDWTGKPEDFLPPPEYKRRKSALDEAPMGGAPR